MMWRTLRRKWWFWLGLTGGALALLAVVGFYAEWKITRARGEARLAEAVAKLDADDPNWRAADLCAVRNAGLPSPEENSADRALQAVSLIPKSFQDWTKDEKLRADLQPGILPYEEDICEASAAYGECAEALAVARTLRHMPRGGFPLVFKEPDTIGTLLDKTQKLREVGSLLDLDVIVLSYRGRSDEAIASAHALLNTGRALGDEPTLISQLVRMALVAMAKSATERTLSWGEPATGLAELQAAFAEESTVPRLTYGLRGERASFFHLLENMDDGLLSVDHLTDGPRNQVLWGRLATRYYRKYIPDQQAAMLGMFNQMLAADKLSGPARKEAVDTGIELPPRGYKTLLVYLLMPACDKVAQADTRTRAYTNCTAAALACERYRRKFGGWPASLQAIPKNILPAVPADPYTGSPLLYRLTDDGAAVYATGPDLIDDGGTTLAPQGKPGTDIGFRLFNLDKRRQPPPPRPGIGDPPPLPDGPPGVVVP